MFAAPGALVFRLHNEVENGHEQIMPALKTIRRLVTWFAAGLVSAVAFGVVSEWFVHVADDKGWYTNAGQTWDGAMIALISTLTSPLAINVATAAVCLAVGMWLDFVLYRRERAPIEAAMEKAAIDRLALADQALRVGTGICTLAAQGAARERVAWEADTAQDHMSRERSTREQAITIEKYAERYHAEAWLIIDQASRLLNLDDSSLWRVSHGLSHSSDLDEMGRLLLSLSNGLKYPGNPVLPRMREVERLNESRSGQAGGLQLPDGAAPES